MPIPDFQSILLPLMGLCADGKEHAISETTEALADQFKLSDDERKALLPSGVQEVFRYRVAWAKSHLKMAGLLEAPRRGIYRITERGLEAVGQNPAFIKCG
jgi:restriction system protein